MLILKPVCASPTPMRLSLPVNGSAVKDLADWLSVIVSTRLGASLFCFVSLVSSLVLSQQRPRSMLLDNKWPEIKLWVADNKRFVKKL